MLHILLTILKIIGIILLAILGILILLTVVVLFVPLRYQITAESKGDLKTTCFHAKFSWLLHLISGQVTYENEMLDWKVRIAWKKLPALKEGKQGAEEQRESVQLEEKKVSEQATEPEASKECEKQPDSKEPEKQSKLGEEPQKTSKFEKIKYTIQKICDKIKSIISVKNKIVAFLENKIHIMAFGRLKEEVFRLAKLLKPKKIRGNIHFGMEDPYQTGQVLALLSVLYPFYGENVEIYPDFEKKVLEGDLYIKGHVRGVYVVIVVWNLIFDKNIRTTFRDIKALK